MRLEIEDNQLASKARRHKVRFTLTLLTGSVLSCFWFLLHFVITQEHEVDSDVINYAGRLRLHTQHFGLVYLATSLAIAVERTGSTPVLAKDTTTAIATIDSICQGLLGTSEDDPTIPEIRDQEVKDSLRLWMTRQLEPLRQSISRSPRNATQQELANVMLLVSDATQAVDDVVDQASSRAKMRVDIILAISIARVILGIIWAVITGYFFGQLWVPYIETYTRLQDAEIELKSLLRAAFDMVIPVKTVAPFEIMGCHEELRHFLGSTGSAPSILEVASGPDEERELEKFLQGALGPVVVDIEEKPRETCSQRLRRLQARFSNAECCWWQFLPGKKNGAVLPVAPMIRTRWKSGTHEDAPQRGINVEVLIVSGGKKRQEAALLAVRATGEEAMDAHVPAIPGPIQGFPWPNPIIADLEEALQRTMSNYDGNGHEGTVVTRSTDDTGDTALGNVPLGTISPASELETTPPPTVIGAGMSPAGNLRGAPPRPPRTTHAEARALAEQLQERLQAASSSTASL